MRILLAVIALIAVACSPGETAESSTTSSTSTSQPTSTTRAPTTTSSSTTTSTVTTTTTTTASTTTTGLLAGNWADGPLITTEFGALGWWDGDDWLDAETEGALPVVGGEDYQTIVGDDLSVTTGGPQTSVCEPLGLIGVELSDDDLLGSFPGPYGVAISAPWPLQPHLFGDAADDGTYAGFAASLLSSRGLAVARPVIKQLIRTDLEGDGVNEVLVVAEDVTEGLLLEPGDYSIVFMRKVVNGEVQTAVFDETIVLDDDGQFGGAHTVGTVADLNGDGKMEIVTNSAFFEGFGVTVWEYANDDLGPIIRLLTGCGS